MKKLRFYQGHDSGFTYIAIQEYKETTRLIKANEPKYQMVIFNWRLEKDFDLIYELDVETGEVVVS